MIRGDLEQAPAALEADSSAGRVLERRQEVEEGRCGVATELQLERVRVDALGVVRDGVQLGAVTLGDHERAVVRRRLDEHAPFPGVAGDDEVKRLQRPVRDQDLTRCNAVVLGQPLT